MGNVFINDSDVFLGAVLGAFLSSIGFIFKYIFDEAKIRRRASIQINVFCDVLLILYKDNDYIQCKEVLMKLANIYSDYFNDFNKEDFTRLFYLVYFPDDESEEKFNNSIKKIRIK